MSNKNNIELPDDEFRVIGRGPKQPEKKKGLPWLWVAALCILAVVAAILFLVRKHAGSEPETGIFESRTEAVIPQARDQQLLGAPVDSTAGPYVEIVDTTINDVVLTIYLPNNATPVLCVGNPSAELRAKGVLAFQAADIRADNRKILGAFVLKGEPLAWGLSKKGFVAIINGKVTVGVSENSPLFEEATEKGGYFFRQYPLVDKGILCESELKGKTMRKAICDRAGQVFCVVSETDESMHDFAQALIDLGVNNAVYLVGSHYSFGWCRHDLGSEPSLFAEDEHKPMYKNESYIIWK